MQVTFSDEGKRKFTSMNIRSLINQCMNWSESIHYIQSSEPDFLVMFDLIILKSPTQVLTA